MNNPYPLPITRSRVTITISRLLSDQSVGEAIYKAARHSVRVRNLVTESISDWGRLREQARSAREKVLSSLDHYLDLFIERFTNAGGVIHKARTASEATQAVVEILKSYNAKKGVKAKSMVSEEVGLGEVLRKEGIEFVESDLGEFIVQLAGEPPSHITAPALHRTASSISQLLTKTLGMPPTDDPAQMTRFVREYMREWFIQAQFAISGVNFLVAESGHLAIVENEGNGKAGWTFAPVVIAITGIEKLVATLADLALLIKMLPPSATGQKITAYLHLLKPPLFHQGEERKIHLVLVDNGRRDALADEGLREILLCVRCGACLNICPVYRAIGGHGYLSVYPGPMGAIWTNILRSTQGDPGELAELSTLCGACREICPVGIDIPRMLLEIRSRRNKPMLYKLFAAGWEWTMSSPQRLLFIGKLGRKLAPLSPMLKTRLGHRRRSFRETIQGNGTNP